jgi:hypothetical protein
MFPTSPCRMKSWVQAFSLLVVAALPFTGHALQATPTDSGLSNLSGTGGGEAFIGTEYGSVEWAAIGFTPSENCTLTSVTLMLGGYTGYSYGPGPIMPYQPVVGIYSNANLSKFGGPNQGPLNEISLLNTPAANDGSTACFTFDCSLGLSLQAGQTYWITVEGTDEYTAGSFIWEGGGTPSGAMTYDGCEQYDGGAYYQPSGETPAFAINVAPTSVASVPEPSTYALMMIPLGLQAARWLRKRYQIWVIQKEG